ncbi:MAG TPA: hypothetical protein VHC44_17790, partial [Verrucomicrobiae bacterium]|nr:hypothetical protein [Verrucomicrobiae bacterium]
MASTPFKSSFTGNGVQKIKLPDRHTSPGDPIPAPPSPALPCFDTSLLNLECVAVECRSDDILAT